jgi:beta-mannosidase
MLATVTAISDGDEDADRWRTIVLFGRDALLRQAGLDEDGLFLVHVCFVRTPSGPMRRELQGPWWFRRHPQLTEDGGTEQWMPATVPGCVHTDLLANKRIEEPFFGTNADHLSWIDDCAWEYQTSFAADDGLLSSDCVELVWKGLDTYAEVWLNGVAILSANNMFREWRVDVKSLICKGENRLLVLFRSPLEQGRAAYDRLGHALPAANDQGSPMLSMFTRKAPYHFGWDWAPRLVTCGIWRPVLLDAWVGGRIDDVQVDQTALTDERACLRVRTTVVASRDGRGRVGVSLAEGMSLGEAEAELTSGFNVLEVHATIDRPRRWWPNGLGRPHLYAIHVTLVVDAVDRDRLVVRAGLRTLEVVHSSDSGGKSFTVRVNGAAVFMKGANYIPADTFLPRVTSERYRLLLQSAADANMNMVRVWGGGVYENDHFYDLCDELGILVWQDFMFACSMYPGGDDFVDNVRQEAIQNVKRLRNHPSLALWSGNNEIEAAWKRWGWQDKFHLSEEAQTTMWGDYLRIFHGLLPEVVAKHDPARFYTRSSPSANDDDVLPDTLGFGDMHYWGVWHAEKPYALYAENVSRFMSEYGFQSFPEIDTVARYAAEEEWRIDSPVMVAHQRHPRGNELIRTYMERDFRTPKNFASFLYVSQVLQGMIIQFAAEAHRRRWPYNAGSLYWQLNDCWPVASWSGIDYFGRWKALHYFARRFFAPVLVSTVEGNGTVTVYVISDRRADAAARLSLRLVDFDGGELWRHERPILIEANTSKAYFTVSRQQLLERGEAHRSVLVVEAFEGPSRLSRSLHHFVKTKYLDLSDPELEVEACSTANGAIGARVSARRFAKSVRLSADSKAGRFSDNYFDVLPGEELTVEWQGPTAPRLGEAVSIRDTY